MDEGYIKYKCNWTKSKITKGSSILNELTEIRSKLIVMGMIGKIPNGPGYGNISVRQTETNFYITGTNTGHFSNLSPEHMALVTQVDIDKNEVWCRGFTQASSESLSHAAIYETLSWVNAIIHVHYKPIWKHNLNILPTTEAKVAYGTPEMALEIKKKILANPLQKVLVLGGHEDGLIVFGTNLKDAFFEIENLFRAIE